MDDQENLRKHERRLRKLYAARNFIDQQISEELAHVFDEYTVDTRRPVNAHFVPGRLVMEFKTHAIMPHRGRGRKPGTMTAEERRQVSDRLKRYWAGRRAAGA